MHLASALEGEGPGVRVRGSWLVSCRHLETPDVYSALWFKGATPENFALTHSSWRRFFLSESSPSLAGGRGKRTRRWHRIPRHWELQQWRMWQ